MANKTNRQSLFFVVNTKAGSGENLKETIEKHFAKLPVDVEIFELPEKCEKDKIKTTIMAANPDRVIAVGGDGTLKLVSECLLETEIPVGIIPAGSANGMAKELLIPTEIEQALDLCYQGNLKQIHAVSINNELCLHLADIGFNAYIVKKFDELPERGMWTYAKATWNAFWNHRKMDVEFQIGNRLIKEKAAMVALANATKYGSGLQINPKGKLDDDLFEVILVKEYAVLEILKIWISKLPWNAQKIESFQTEALTITTKHHVHFQVDGEYFGKVKEVKAKLIPKAITLIVP